MEVKRSSPLFLILIIASSALATFPYSSYPEFHPAVSSFGPHLIYNSGVGGSAGLTGFSYFTKDLGGGESEVVFFTGPNSDDNMNNEVAAMKDQMNSMPSDTTDNKPDKIEDNETTSGSTGVEEKETTTGSSEEETVTTTVTPKKEDDKIGQLIPGKTPGFETPYPVFRLSGSSSFYPQLSAPFSGFGGYEPSNYFRSQYDPFYNRFNSYQGIYNPFYPTFEKDYYYDTIFRSIYPSPIPFPPQTTPDTPPSGLSPDEKLTEKIPVTKIDKRIKEGETQTDDETTSTEDKEKPENENQSEISTSTEITSEKPTTASAETSSTTTEDIKETATVSDAVAVA